MNSLNYKNKHTIVTGCYSGIGHAVARELLAQGAQVHGIDLRRPELPLQGFQRVDLTDLDALGPLAVDLPGQVDALFNCAGLGPSHQDDSVITVNFLATRVLTELVVPRMRPGGAIASVASIGGAAWPAHVTELLDFLSLATPAEALAWYRVNSGLFPNAYSFSKEAICVWTRQQATVLIERGIRINCTSPGATRTPMLDEIENKLPTFSGIDNITRPIGRCSTPEEQAWPLLLLNSELFSYVNGAELAVDGGGAALATVNKPE